ncbi:MAG: tyrosine-type recombinase/integrase [Leptolyngbya sp. SIO3F4]|nr:tyrosine-type recombinase/integrase [Leptolyngbya sp. SIO3F4]
MNQLATVQQNAVLSGGNYPLPAIIQSAGENASYRFVDFFVAEIRNKNTRRAYLQAISIFFAWIEHRYPSLELVEINSLIVGQFVEFCPGSPTTKNLRLAAIRKFFAWLVAGGILRDNPTAEVKGVKHRVKQGKTPVLSDEEMKDLFDSFDVSHVVGLRDRALVGVMFYSFARVGAVLAMDVSDYFQKKRRAWFRLHEKGGKYHEVPAHHTVQEFLDEYLDVAGIRDEAISPLFRTTRGKSRKLTRNRMQPQEALAMVKRRALDAGVNPDACNHSFRASGITNYLRHGGSRDNAQKIACHEDIRTTALYDRRAETVSLDEIERIRL